ncbi:MAG: toxic anion resistance protein [Rhodobacteraceae bacterium]|nr:toxic anion resistance protein [Paracoccaceae bacterium]
MFVKEEKRESEDVSIIMAEASPEMKKQIESRMAEIDMSDASTFLRFGSKTHGELQKINRQMLSGVQNRDLGTSSDWMEEICTTLRDFNSNNILEPRSWYNWFSWGNPIAKFMKRYETVQSQIDEIKDKMLEREKTLLNDIKSLDELYARTLDFYDDLVIHIAAGDEKIKEIDERTIPAREQAAGTAPKHKAMMKAQELRDVRIARDDLERRVHDLKMTRQVAMQLLPEIRLVQENSKSLVKDINSTLANALPLWETQLAQAMTVHRSRAVAEVARQSKDLTNEILESGAANVQQANAEISRQTERGVFDIESIKNANQILIDTIQERIRIADEGRAHRASAETELQTMEDALEKAVSVAKAPRDSVARTNTDCADSGIGDIARAQVPD